MNKKRWATLILLIAAGLAAWYGGTYNGPDYFAMTRAEAEFRDSLGLLKHQVDSLKLFYDSLSTNLAVQERYARKEWGMLRPGELTFKIIPAPADSGKP